MVFHHVGIACKDIQETLEYVKNTFDVESVSKEVFDAKQNATLCMVDIKNGFKLELISGEVVKAFIKKRQYLYHTCYEVENIEAAIDQCSNNGVVLSQPKEAILFDNKRVVFIMTPIGLIELLEK